MKDNNAGPGFNTSSYTASGIGILITFILVFITERMVLKSSNGVFSYPLDDPFIHMELAKNLAFHGTWGINPGEFGSASSSLLYTVLLTVIFKIFSVHVIVPFIINCIAAIILIFVVDAWLKKQSITFWGRMGILILLIFFLPLPALIISGMEHTLQCLFTFLFLTSCCDWLDKVRMEGSEKNKLPWRVIVFAILVTAVRYEGIFLVAIVCLLLLYFRKIKTAFLLGFLSLLPVIIFGIYSIQQGSYFLPNSVLVKSNEIRFSMGGIIEFFSNTLINKFTIVKEPLPALPSVPPPGISLLATQRLLIILPLVGLLFIKQIRQKPSYVYLLSILLLCTLVHLTFAATGWFYRYEAYLIGCSFVLVSAILVKYYKDIFPGKRLYKLALTAILLFALVFPMILRSGAAFSKSKQACLNIHEQQYQMAQFLKKYYNEDVVAANDIGAIAFYTDTKIIDLWGLGSIDVAKSKKGKYWTASFLDSFVRKNNVTLAIVYDEWFSPELLNKWTKVATWEISNNVIAGGDFVSFYSINKDDSRLLKGNLSDFQKYLPATVRVAYIE